MTSGQFGFQIEVVIALNDGYDKQTWPPGTTPLTYIKNIPEMYVFIDIKSYNHSMREGPHLGFVSYICTLYNIYIYSIGIKHIL